MMLTPLSNDANSTGKRIQEDANSYFFGYNDANFSVQIILKWN